MYFINKMWKITFDLMSKSSIYCTAKVSIEVSMLPSLPPPPPTTLKNTNTNLPALRPQSRQSQLILLIITELALYKFYCLMRLILLWTDFISWQNLHVAAVSKYCGDMLPSMCVDYEYGRWKILIAPVTCLD